MTTAAGRSSRAFCVLMAVPWDEKRGGVVGVADTAARYLRRQGHTVLMFHPGRTVFVRYRPTQLGQAGVTLRLVAPAGDRHRALRTVLFPVLFATSLVQLAWLVSRHRIDVINVHYPIDEFFYFGVCRRLLGVRLVVSAHGNDLFHRGNPKAHYSWAMRLLMNAADLVVLPSAVYRHKVEATFRPLRGKVITIHNGVDTAVFKPTATRGEDSERYILCVAELREYKGVDVLLRAAQPLLSSDPSLTLVIAGDGPLRRELEQLAESLGVEQRVRFLGARPVADIVTLLQDCELCVLPSRQELFGMALVEAMACGKPVVASDVGGIPEIVDDGRTGVLVEPESVSGLTAAMQKVLGDALFRATLSENGYRKVVERFHSELTGAGYEIALAGVVGTRVESTPCAA